HRQQRKVLLDDVHGPVLGLRLQVVEQSRRDGPDPLPPGLHQLRGERAVHRATDPRVNRRVRGDDVPTLALPVDVVPPEHLLEDGSPAVLGGEQLRVAQHVQNIVVAGNRPQAELFEVVDARLLPQPLIGGIRVLDRSWVVRVVVDAHSDTPFRPGMWWVLAARAAADHCMVSPPSTEMLCPVMKEASSEARKATACASSSGSPIRPSGVIATVPASLSSGERRSIGVSIAPGETQLTRTPSLPY